jgi:hypothetical protein
MYGTWNGSDADRMATAFATVWSSPVEVFVTGLMLANGVTAAICPDGRMPLDSKRGLN